MRAPPSRKLLSSPLKQQSPTFLAPETGFLEDNFPKNQGVGDGFRMIQGYCIYCGFYVYYFCIVIYNEITIQVTGNAKRVGALSLFSWNVTVPSLGDGRAMGSSCKYRWSLTHWPAVSEAFQQNYLPKALPPNTITLWGRDSTTDSEGINYSIHSNYTDLFLKSRQILIYNYSLLFIHS